MFKENYILFKGRASDKAIYPFKSNFYLSFEEVSPSYKLDKGILFNKASFFRKESDYFEKVGEIEFFYSSFCENSKILFLSEKFQKDDLNTAVLFFKKDLFSSIFIQSFNIEEKFKGHGYGRHILNWLESYKESSNIFFLTENDSFVEFYQKSFNSFELDFQSCNFVNFKRKAYLI